MLRYYTMTCEELQEAINRTKAEIEEVKQQIAQAADPREKRRLILRKRELQYMQMWHIEQLNNFDRNK
jgi:tmRNA-binding protein